MKSKREATLNSFLIEHAVLDKTLFRLRSNTKQGLFFRFLFFTWAGKVALHELDLFKGSSAALVKVCGLGEDLVDDPDL